MTMVELSGRDKNMLMAGAVFLVVFCVVQFIYFPAVDKQKSLKRTLMAQDAAIDQMRKLQKTFQDISIEMDQQKIGLGKRQKNFTLFSFLDLQAEKSGVKKNVAYMKPSTQDIEKNDYTISKVKVKLENVYLRGMMDFLSRIEASPDGVIVTSLSLSKTGKEGDKLDAVLDTQTLILKEAS
ncbi:MAG: hypothetical protein ABIJ31_10070 [Pseudomonadota bacterium]